MNNKDEIIKKLQIKNGKLQIQIERLKLDKEEYYLDYLNLQQRIDEAIEYIRNNCILSNEWNDLDFCNFVPTGNIKYKQLTSKKVKYLLDILRGKDNE